MTQFPAPHPTRRHFLTTASGARLAAVACRRSTSAPLLLWLHGAGQSGEGSLRRIGPAADPARVTLGGFSDGATYALSIGLANGDLFPQVIGCSPGFIAQAPPPAIAAEAMAWMTTTR